ncbi:MAG TPA: hypothetical protein VKR06_00050 [Ktedonosporobacter sp.]|nr:hypothetical protein [Ktedonosporobacter sp.]
MFAGIDRLGQQLGSYRLINLVIDLKCVQVLPSIAAAARPLVD